MVTPHDDDNRLTIPRNRSGALWADDPEAWRALTTEDGCPWCQGPGPPAAEVMAETATCWVTAPVVAPLPAYVCVSTKAHVIEPYDLDDATRDRFFAEAMAVARGVAAAVNPVKMNYEIHGNTIPHLHMHIYPRTAGDVYVGYPITNRATFTRTAEDLSAIASAINAELSK
jgi:diadenosine tetraphosphate (Ap4A) HIT family hydrolase